MCVLPRQSREISPSKTFCLTEGNHLKCHARDRKKCRPHTVTSASTLAFPDLAVRSVEDRRLYAPACVGERTLCRVQSAHASFHAGLSHGHCQGICRCIRQLSPAALPALPDRTAGWSVHGYNLCSYFTINYILELVQLAYLPHKSEFVKYDLPLYFFDTAIKIDNFGVWNKSLAIYIKINYKIDFVFFAFNDNYIRKRIGLPISCTSRKVFLIAKARIFKLFVYSKGYIIRVAFKFFP